MNERQKRLQPFERMIGEWDIKSGEKASDGEFFEESGTRLCQWALNQTVIRCEDNLTIEKSSPRYKRLGNSRHFVQYLTYNSTANRYEIWFMSATSIQVSIVSVEYDSKDNSLINTSKFELSWLKEKVENKIRRWFVSPDEMRERNDIKSLSSDFNEVFEMKFYRKK